MEPWTDVNGDARYESKKGDIYKDIDGNSTFDTYWLAGFGNGVAAQGVHDDLWARTMEEDPVVVRVGGINLRTRTFTLPIKNRLFRFAAFIGLIEADMSGWMRKRTEAAAWSIGPANDEIGYIIPKSQWDVRKPFVYRDKPYYGEEISLGAETAPLLYNELRFLLEELNNILIK